MTRATRILTAVSMLVLAGTTIAMSDGAIPRKAPNFVMIRGGNLKKAVTLTHLDCISRRAADSTCTPSVYSPIMKLYQNSVAARQPDNAEIVLTYEVAEFSTPSAPGRASVPSSPLKFEEATHHSKIYLIKSGEMIWDRPYSASISGGFTLVVVSEQAKAILGGLGLRVK